MRRWPFAARAADPAPAPAPPLRRWDAMPPLVPRSLSLQPVARSADFSRGLGTRQDSPVVLRAPEHALARHPGGHVDGLVSHVAVPAAAAPHPTAVPRRGFVGRRRRAAAAVEEPVVARSSTDEGPSSFDAVSAPPVLPVVARVSAESSPPPAARPSAAASSSPRSVAARSFAPPVPIASRPEPSVARSSSASAAPPPGGSLPTPPAPGVARTAETSADLHRATPAAPTDAPAPLVARTPISTSPAPATPATDGAQPVLRTPAASRAPGRPVRAGLQPPVHRAVDPAPDSSASPAEPVARAVVQPVPPGSSAARSAGVAAHRSAAGRDGHAVPPAAGSAPVARSAAGGVEHAVPSVARPVSVARSGTDGDEHGAPSVAGAAPVARSSVGGDGHAAPPATSRAPVARSAVGSAERSVRRVADPAAVARSTAAAPSSGGSGPTSTRPSTAEGWVARAPVPIVANRPASSPVTRVRRVATEPGAPSAGIHRSFDATAPRPVRPAGPTSTPVARQTAPGPAGAAPVVASPASRSGRAAGSPLRVARAGSDDPAPVARAVDAPTPQGPTAPVPPRTLSVASPVHATDVARATTPAETGGGVHRAYDADAARAVTEQPTIASTPLPEPTTTAHRLPAPDARPGPNAPVARALPVASPQPETVRRAPVRTAGRAPLGLGWPPAAPDPGGPSAASAERVTARTLHRAPVPEPVADIPADPLDAGAVAVAAGIARRVDPTEVRFAAPGGQGPYPSAARAGTVVAERAPEPEQQQPAEVVAAGPAAAPAQDLGALADELWERLELRLRTDLMLERERRGTWPDA